MAGITPKHSEWCKPPKMCGSCQEALRERVVALSEKLTTSEAKLTKAHAVIDRLVESLEVADDCGDCYYWRENGHDSDCETGKALAAAFAYQEAALRGEGGE